MTNEEAIKILFNIRAYYASLTAGYPPHDCYGLGDMKCSDMCNALLKGIRLLKQESCEDCVSRQAVIELAEKGVLVSNGNYKSVCNAINELPPVNPQPKTGHWIKIKPYPLQMHEYECSECLHETDDNTENYCSECGAKMESEE